ncbi:T9SS type A sorting domain-containing protein [Dyadobacter frigoris]|uniref:Secretion system C-terminal sorting domain-containing protein n=1 Tax=Dyadobacter frigoris TaxID=2576211 RepID=A0A4U6D796_9BACT|nr:T9SS type A sorting domain-containing protein [Dyadobacter frigoris]TKT93290.1 hypothetical protein FDK13_05400 [Dyadobacter frigoris]
MKKSLLFLLLVLSGFKTFATKFIVTTTSDLSSPGETTLRDAINSFNVAGTGPHEINFQVAGTIVLNSNLPTIKNTNLQINGYTAPGSSIGSINSRNITVAINLNGYNGFNIYSEGGVTISGLSIYNTGPITSNIGIQATYTFIAGIWIWGCYLGIKETGAADGTTNTNCGIKLIGGNPGSFFTATIGTNGDGMQDAAEGNVITNTYYNPDRYEDYSVNCGIVAVYVNDLIIAGNYIGPTDKTGNTVSISNTNKNGGIFIRQCKRITVGTNGNEVSDAFEGNVISGNGRDGIKLMDVSELVIAGNIVGLGSDGSTELGNGIINGLSTTIVKTGTNGIAFALASDLNLNIRIGTNGDGKSDVLERNVISAHKQNVTENDFADGLEISKTQNILIAGNYIGTDITGTLPRGNANNGIGAYRGTGGQSMQISQLLIGYDDNVAGTSLEVMRNVISSNGENAIELLNMTGSTRKISGNFIGLNSSGIGNLGNRNGINIRGTGSVLVGTDGDGINDNLERNYICNNSSSGLLLNASNNIDDYNSPGRAINTKISGNNIGEDFQSQAAGNGYGVLVIHGSLNNIIGSDAGSPSTAKGNIIAHNVHSGVAIGNVTPDLVPGERVSIGNLVSRNSFYNNGGLPIDLLDRNKGVDVNDGILVNDGVNGPSFNNSNNALDYPIFTKFVVNTNNSITVSGYVGKGGASEEIAGSTINEVLNIEVYLEDDDGNQNGAVSVGFPRTAAHGEGKVFLGDVLTDNTGKFTDVTFNPASAVTQTDRITGTASRQSPNRSTSEFGIMSKDIILPVTLIVFQAKVLDNKVALNWSTAQEFNSDYYEVERSSDIKSWKKVAYIKSIGNSNKINKYSCLDEFPISGLTYYRLKQVDWDGTVTYFKIQSVNMTSPDFQIYPNPAKGILNIEGPQLKNIQILNKNGVTISNIPIKQLNPTKAVLDISLLPNDIYIIIMGNQAKKILKDF